MLNTSIHRVQCFLQNLDYSEQRKKWCKNVVETMQLFGVNATIAIMTEQIGDALEKQNMLVITRY